MLKCQLCDFSHPYILSTAHIKSHGLTTKEYRQQFPDAKLRIQTDEMRAKMSLAKSGKPSKLKGRVCSDEHKAAVSVALKNIYKSGEFVHWNTGNTTPDEVKEKISTSNIGIKNNGTAKQIAAKYSRIFSSATKYNCEILSIDNENKTAMAKCNSCHTQFSFTQQIFNPTRLNKIGKLCPVCQPRETFSSAAEKEVAVFISNYVGIIPNDRSQLGGKEIDIFVPSLNIGFEFTGLYWHSVKQNPDTFHLLHKSQYAFKRGIKLITIFEDEWMLKPHLVRSKILNALGICNTQYIDDMIIKEISIETKKQFLLNNNLSGDDECTVAIGGFLSDELISIATFDVINDELVTFCSIDCPHSLKLLLDYFVHRFNKQTETIIVYADRRWTDDVVLINAGFSYVSEQPPRCWNVINYKTRQIYPVDNCDQIWDCGTSKWVLK